MMGRMDDLIAFLHACFDEDVAVAQAVGFDHIEAVDFLWDGKYLELQGPEGSKSTDALPSDLANHAARHDPARVLAEVHAKRQMLDAALSDRHHVSADQYETCPRATAADGLTGDALAALEALNEERRREDGIEPECWDSCGRDARMYRTLRLLALPYADQPGYQPEWDPTADKDTPR